MRRRQQQQQQQLAAAAQSQAGSSSAAACCLLCVGCCSSFELKSAAQACLAGVSHVAPPRSSRAGNRCQQEHPRCATDVVVSRCRPPSSPSPRRRLDPASAVAAAPAHPRAGIIVSGQTPARSPRSCHRPINDHTHCLRHREVSHRRHAVL